MECILFLEFKSCINVAYFSITFPDTYISFHYSKLYHGWIAMPLKIQTSLLLTMLLTMLPVCRWSYSKGFTESFKKVLWFLCVIIHSMNSHVTAVVQAAVIAEYTPDSATESRTWGPSFSHVGTHALKIIIIIYYLLLLFISVLFIIVIYYCCYHWYRAICPLSY